MEAKTIFGVNQFEVTVVTPVVCHIPHASREIPAWARADFCVSEEELQSLLDFMTDADVDRLWSFVPREDRVVFETSRLVTDVERYLDDAREPMAALGMGMYYTHTPDGKKFRRRTQASYDACRALYETHHRSLQTRVAAALQEANTCILLDCHSFHDGMTHTPYLPSSFPDVCIGTNAEVSLVAREIVRIFESHGYQVALNRPFSGALVPTQLASDPRLTSVMIELNRRIYENDFEKAQAVLKEVYQALLT